MREGGQRWFLLRDLVVEVSATRPGGQKGVAGHLPNHPLPLGGKKGEARAPAFVSCLRRKARDTCWDGFTPQKQEGGAISSCCMPAPGGELGTKRCLPRFTEVSYRPWVLALSLGKLFRDLFVV